MAPWYRILPNILQRGIWVPTRLTLRFFVHFRITGWQQVASLPRGVIFALNHSSELDAVILPASFPFLSILFPMFYLSRPRDFYKRSGWRQYFYGGTLFLMWGAYPAPVNQHNYEASLKHHVTILQRGNSLCVFPEGGVSPDGTLRKGRGAVSYLSWRSGKPVVPVAIKGSWGMSIGDFLLRRKSISINFGDPIFPRELFLHCQGEPVVNATQNDFNTATVFIMSKISELKERYP